tara:strand:+ start:495 stop:665 length:171 start_codon:yes stop_codon:yes gene_type:complete
MKKLKKKSKKIKKTKKGTFKFKHLFWLVLFLGLFAWGFSNPAGTGFISPSEKGVLK